MIWRIREEEKINFIKNLSLMIRGGIPISESLGLLAEQVRAQRLARLLREGQESTAKGQTLHQIFTRESRSFGPVFTNIVKAGESSGSLSENLKFLADWLEREHTLRQKISVAMLYPKIILAFALLLIAFLTTFVLPRIIPVFTRLEVELPLATRALLAITDFMKTNWIAVWVVVLGIVPAWWLIRKIGFVKRGWDWCSLRIPIFGRLAQEKELALMSYLMATLFRSGFSVTESLQMTAETMSNTYYRRALEDIKNRVEQGTALAEAMKLYPGLFPLVLSSVITTGERSGTLVEALDYLAGFYAGEIDTRVKKLPVVLEPLLLIAVGLLVGFVALAVMMPIYELTKGF